MTKTKKVLHAVEIIRGIHNHTKVVEHEAAHNHLEKAKEEMVKMAPYLEFAKTEGGQIKKLAVNLERRIGVLIKHIDSGGLNAKEFLVQFIKFFVPEAYALVGLLGRKAKIEIKKLEKAA